MKLTRKARAPEDRELNAGTGLTLAALGALMQVLCYFADGHLAALPAALGQAFLVIGVIILVLNWSGLRRRGRA